MKALIFVLVFVSAVSALPGGRLHGGEVQEEVPAVQVEEKAPAPARSNKKLGNALVPIVSNCTTYLKVLANNAQIKGDSKERSHLNWLEVTNVKHEITVDGDTRTHAPLYFQKNLDRATLALYGAFVDESTLDVTVEVLSCQHLSYGSEFTIQTRLTGAWASGVRTDKGVETWEISYETVKWSWLQTQESVTDNWDEQELFE